MQRSKQIILTLTIVTLMQPAFAHDTASIKKEYSPYLDQNYPLRPLFGDTHLHTSYSTDAGLTGNRLGPDEADRFALGEEITSGIGVHANILKSVIEHFACNFCLITCWNKGILSDTLYT